VKTLTPRTTPRTRARLAALTAVPLLLLTGCGGDDSDDSPDHAPGAGGPGGGGGRDVPTMEGEDCDADVSLSGALTAQWSGGAKVDVTADSDVSPPATYQSNHDAYMLTVSAVGNGFDDPSVTLLADGRSFAVPFGEGSVEVAADGSGATLDAPANEIGADGSVAVRATFDC
jgi:hypothetical protein